MAKEKINALIDGGHATAGPPLGPKLGPLGINIQKLIGDINTATKSFEGIKVPVDIIVDKDSKTWTIEIGTPSASQLIFKEMKLPKGGGGISTKEVKPKAGAKKEAAKPGEAKPEEAKPEEKKEKKKEEPKAEEAPAEVAAPKVLDKAAAIVGNASRDIIIKIAKLKMKDMGTRTLTGAVKTVIGTCLSSCIKVDGKDPREAQKDVDAGLWDEDIKTNK
jgi:large subunit ribosomal protein L11